jgi:hypothetical protein
MRYAVTAAPAIAAQCLQLDRGHFAATMPAGQTRDHTDGADAETPQNIRVMGNQNRPWCRQENQQLQPESPDR